jgi:hypothetical protein
MSPPSRRIAKTPIDLGLKCKVIPGEVRPAPREGDPSYFSMQTVFSVVMSVLSRNSFTNAL